MVHFTALVRVLPEARAVGQRGRVEVMLAYVERLTQCRMEDVKVDQDPAAVLLELLVPRSNLVLPTVVIKVMHSCLFVSTILPE